MTPCGTSLLLAALLAPGQADLDATLKNVQQQAQAAGDALVKQDFAKLVDLSHPKAIEAGGGKEKMVEELQRLVKAMKSKGIAFVSSKAELPTKIFRAGADEMTVVPTAIALDTPDGKVGLKGFLVAVSRDQGKKWVFVDGAIGDARIRELLPNMPEAMKLPEPQTPKAPQ